MSRTAQPPLPPPHGPFHIAWTSLKVVSGAVMVSSECNPPTGLRVSFGHRVLVEWAPFASSNFHSRHPRPTVGVQGHMRANLIFHLYRIHPPRTDAMRFEGSALGTSLLLSETTHFTHASSARASLARRGIWPALMALLAKDRASLRTFLQSGTVKMRR